MRLAIATFCAFSAGILFAQAQSFQGPTSPAPDNGLLGNILHLTQFLQIDSGTNYPLQSVASPLVFDISGAQPVRTTFGRTNANNAGGDQAGIMATVGSSPTPLSQYITNNTAGIYGFAGGSATNYYGAYGYGTGVGSIGVEGIAPDGSGFAGSFLGKVGASAVVTDDTIASAQFTATSNDKGIPAVRLDNGSSAGGITLTGTLTTALESDAIDYYGIAGLSATGIGYDSQLTIQNRTDGIEWPVGVTSNRFVSVHGIADTGATAGVYGLSAKHNGVEGVVGPTSAEAAIEATDVGKTDGSPIAVLGSNSGSANEWTGIIEGALKLHKFASLNNNQPILIIGSLYGFTTNNIPKVIDWCRKFGNSYCPDDHIHPDTTNYSCSG